MADVRDDALQIGLRLSFGHTHASQGVHLLHAVLIAFPGNQKTEYRERGSDLWFGILFFCHGASDPRIRYSVLGQGLVAQVVRAHA